VHYQVIVDAATHAVSGVEALARWRHPRLGMVPPDVFIPIAEETGLIVPIGAWILREACRVATGWPAAVKIAVNLSTLQFGKASLVETVSSVLADTGLAAQRLELEVTESVLLRNSADNLSILHRLKALGLSIVLDDFGTGYSSLGYLRMFPFDKVKIDKSFVAELSTRADCAAIICAITGLTRALDILATAEGVETHDQAVHLRAAGCNLLQGYFFGRPRVAADLTLATASPSGSISSPGPSPLALLA
jgi:EAL domain-containing protein (putative c-di-GMP-specific phosphodiesterase class I)